MSRSSRRLLLLGPIAAGLIALVVTACGDSDPTPVPRPTATPEPVAAAAATDGDAMMDKKDGDAMADTKDGDAMMDKKDGDAMMDTKDGDAMTDKKDGDAMMELPEQRFAAHFVDSAPAHGDAFTVVPEKVLINTDFTLNEISSITVQVDGEPIAAGPTTLGQRKLSMAAALPSDAGDGLYVVAYTACWPDQSCHEGQFAFTVDSEKGSAYLDMTGQAEVAVSMKDLRFGPAAIVVSKGTKVTWKNDDAAVHFVNSDPHPSHNFLDSLNSLELNQSDSFSYTFDEAGEWPYHCSLHVPDGMVGRVVVQ